MPGNFAFFAVCCLFLNDLFSKGSFENTITQAKILDPDQVRYFVADDKSWQRQVTSDHFHSHTTSGLTTYYAKAKIWEFHIFEGTVFVLRQYYFIEHNNELM